jgi:hypothetical protein
MNRFRIAHIRHQGVDLIIVPLDSQFGLKSPADQDEAIASLQACAAAAGLAGTVVPVWDAGGGRMRFIAPPNWHPFFQSIGLHYVQQQLNRELVCP